MKDRNPLFRKIIAPWYDSDAACYVFMLVMLAVLLFSIGGIVVARAHPVYHAHTWLPTLLALMSGSVLVSITIRLIKRYLSR
jgi:hypothetical protein